MAFIHFWHQSLLNYLHINLTIYISTLLEPLYLYPIIYLELYNTNCYIDILNIYHESIIYLEFCLALLISWLLYNFNHFFHQVYVNLSHMILQIMLYQIYSFYQFNSNVKEQLTNFYLNNIIMFYHIYF